MPRFTIPQTWKDTAERVFWSTASLVIAAIPVAIADLDPWVLLFLTPAVNWLTIQIRKHTSVLPSPGEGLPGMSTGVRSVPEDQIAA